MEIPADVQLAAIHELWHRGTLHFKLHAAQRLIYARLSQSTRKRFYLNISRRWGKSYLLLTYAFEQCLQHPGYRVLYVAPFADDARNISTDLATDLAQDCPEDLRPEFNKSTNEFKFKNGSLIRLLGANNDRARYARGIKINLGIVDEAALIDDLEYLIDSVLLPMTLTTKGRILLASTPARSPGHDSTLIAKRCRADEDDFGDYAHFTVYDNPLLTPEVIEQYKRESGGENSSTWRREYLADLDVVDADTAVVPEFDEKARQEMVREWDRPDFYDAYTAIDPGFADRTGMLFGYIDFLHAKLVIEDEALLVRAATPDIAQGIRTKEKAQWGEKAPTVRVSDIDLRLIADLWQLHGLSFAPAQKKDSEGGINLIRTWVQQRKIIINPRCRRLIEQLRSATYDRSGKDFERTAEHGHYDLVAALKYLCRAVNFKKNPYPDWYARRLPNLHTEVRKALRKNRDLGLMGDTPFARRALQMSNRPKKERKPTPRVG